VTHLGFCPGIFQNTVSEQPISAFACALLFESRRPAQRQKPHQYVITRLVTETGTNTLNSESELVAVTNSFVQFPCWSYSRLKTPLCVSESSIGCLISSACFPASSYANVCRCTSSPIIVSVDSISLPSAS